MDAAQTLLKHPAGLPCQCPRRHRPPAPFASAPQSICKMRASPFRPVCKLKRDAFPFAFRLRTDDAAGPPDAAGGLKYWLITIYPAGARFRRRMARPLLSTPNRCLGVLNCVTVKEEES
jgi:hypothetical protein